MDDLNGFVNDNANAIATSLGVVGVGFILGWQSIREFFRGLAMKRERRREIHQLLSQGFTDFIIDKRISGELTLDEALDEGFLRLKRAYPECKEFYPIEALLKERIEARMKSGTHVKVALPMGKKPNMFTIGK